MPIFLPPCSYQKKTGTRDGKNIEVEDKQLLTCRVTVHGDFEKCRLSTWFVAEVVRLRFYLFVEFPNSHESGYDP